MQVNVSIRNSFRIATRVTTISYNNDYAMQRISKALGID